ncbi:AtpZ/AtpI family protein [Campylobacter volucris]|uniref:AtpZ/AtpI family protein n=1 Tax=Campylobacter volucris TaxID=1031542 RepID=A0A5C7DRN0_9BACT|nr:AtpZ/AtpI family protein [Campylobacter volucris]TXE88981.1 AtpZ/AtpI family protein [Campylobacter volucris]
MRKKIIRKSIEAADGLSLGISIVVAVLIGIGIGYFLKKSFGISWLFWIGVFIGVAAAILNVFKAYKAQVKSYEEFKEENRYKEFKNDTKT